MQEVTASLVGAQAEGAHPVQDSTAVSVGTMERSILLLSDCALLPYCPVILIIYILGCAFFVLPIARTRVLLRTAVCFLMWTFSHMGISSHT